MILCKMKSLKKENQQKFQHATKDLLNQAMAMLEDMDMTVVLNRAMDLTGSLEATLDLGMEEVTVMDMVDLFMAKEALIIWKETVKNHQNMFAELPNIPCLLLHCSWKSNTCEETRVQSLSQLLNFLYM